MCYNIATYKFEVHMLNSLLEVMEEVEVKSSYCGYIYRLSDILTIMICGLLANLKDINRIHNWCQAPQVREFLEKEFSITQIPCKSQFYLILSFVNYEVFAQCFHQWMAARPQNKIWLHKTQNK